jgi:hypothetical protein
MNNWLFVGFSRKFLLGVLIFKGLTARRLYKSLSVKGELNFGSGKHVEGWRDSEFTNVGFAAVIPGKRGSVVWCQIKMC